MAQQLTPAQLHQLEMKGPPYPSTQAALGGLPNVTPDVPATAVFLALYLTFAAINMTILQVNLRRKHKFLISGAMFGFCMARTATCVLRIAWAFRQHNVRLAIAANIFINAGILIIYVINIICAQRVLRAKQPHLGWNPIVRGFFKFLYALIGITLAAVITASILQVYTLNAHTHQICRDILLAATTYLTVFVTMPWFILAAAWLLPTHPEQEHFGKGSLRFKSLVIIGSSCLCTLIAGFKCGTNWMPPRPATNPAWYQSKACFYIFNFSLEILILILLTSTRIDQKFHVPDGSKGPGDYTAKRLPSSSVASQNGEAMVEKV